LPQQFKKYAESAIVLSRLQERICKYPGLPSFPEKLAPARPILYIEFVAGSLITGPGRIGKQA
jgi:hypothetical protein